MTNLYLPWTVALVSCTGLAQLPSPSVSPRVAPRAAYATTSGVSGSIPANRHWTQTAHNGTSMFVFGGRTGTGNGTRRNDLWEFDTTTLTWTEHNADGAAGAPPQRFRAACAWSSLSNTLVVFGGEDAAGNVLDDTWEWDPGTNTWTQITPISTPPARRFSSMAELPGAGIVMFGGWDDMGADLNDTWVYVGGTWNQLLPMSTPPARGHHHLVTRSGDFGDVFLCGGQNSLGSGSKIHFLDTWRLDPTTLDWVEITPSTPAVPASAFGNAVAYDPIRQCVVMTGGQGISSNSGATGGAYGTEYGGSPSSWTSEFDCVTDEWRLYGPASFNTSDPVIGRASRYFTAFVGDRIWMWGGQDPSNTSDLTAMKEYQASPLASTTDNGGGCIGLTLTAENDPWLGRPFEATVDGVAATGLIWGFNGFFTQSIPLAGLHPAGIPGCDVLIDLFGNEFLGVGGPITWSIPLPPVPALAGATMHLQAIQLEVGPGNAILSLGASNAIVIQTGAL